MLQVGLRELEVVPVLLLLDLDLAEAPVGAVESLDRTLQLVVDPVDLIENLLCLRLFRRDGAGIGGGRAADDQSRRECYDDAARLSVPRTNTSLQSLGRGADRGAGASQGRQGNSLLGRSQAGNKPKSA